MFGCKHLSTQDLWYKVQPSLSADVTMPMGRGRKDLFGVVHTVSVAYVHVGLIQCHLIVCDY